jgi:hypothetical protein
LGSDFWLESDHTADSKAREGAPNHHFVESFLGALEKFCELLDGKSLPHRSDLVGQFHGSPNTGATQICVIFVNGAFLSRLSTLMQNEERARIQPGWIKNYPRWEFI